MPESDDFGSEIDESEFIAVATQAEASQNDEFQASPRPSKRRRLNDDQSEDNEANIPRMQANLTQEPEDDPAYYFPGEIEELDDQSRKKSKYKIHIPSNGGQFPDQVFTQTQHRLDASPSHFRGAVWKRPQPPPPPPLFGRSLTSGTGNLPTNVRSALTVPVPKQTTLAGFTVRSNRVDLRESFQSDADLAARLQANEDARTLPHNGAHRSTAPFANTPFLNVADELADLPPDAFSSSSPEDSAGKDVVTISSQVTASQAQIPGLRGPQHGLKQMTIFGQPATQGMSASQAAKKRHAWPLKAREELPTHHRLDDKAMETWVYPTNLGTIRDYQYNIVSRSLFHNTLVALPTGLGKTFIAATVMLNYYRWTTDAQIVFMAPTKPLIAQQMEACYHVVGIQRRDAVLMTGETTPALRAEEWLARRAFFMTPQTVINDLKTGICDPKKIVLIVVDEAHKATGGYAYTEVTKFLRRFNNSFRVLALTATPGSTVEAVQAVIDNLGIARVELRTEQSLDIRQYTHQKHTETELFDFSDEQLLIMEHVTKAIRPSLEKLCSQNAYWSRDPMQLSAYGLTNARQKWMASDAGRKAPMPIKGMVNAIFTVLSSLAHALLLLKFHGITPFYSKVLDFQKDVESGQNKGKIAAGIAQSEGFTKMMSTVRGWTNNPDFIGHPKLEYLREVVLNHFLDAGEGNQGPDVSPSATRVMVFASYRDSTEEICRVLKRSEPMIRPHVFVGQAASKGSEGMDQKRQNAVIQDFKSGKYNTLVATSIGEEGLDIGTVDLIVCYDASSSPIRMLQRIGRTGRKRVGKVVLLLMKTKEENDYAKAQDNYAYIQKTIADASKYEYRDEESPRILPKGVQPIVDKRMIDIPLENSQPVDLNEKGRKAKGRGKAKRPPKKFHMPDGVRTGFVKASKLDSDEEGEESEEADAPKRKPSNKRQVTSARSKKVVAPPEPEVVQVPFLEDVLLNSAQQRELERKYAHTADDEADLVVRGPDATRFPASIRQPGPVKYVPHGRASDRVAKALQAMRDIDDEQIERMKELVDRSEMESAGSAGLRLVSPGFEESDEELPSNPLTFSKPKAAPRLKVKKQTLQRTASIGSIATGESAELRSAASIKKPRGRPRKKQAIRRTTSYGSAAAEGNESSPEPTPANMRLGTQGIDLGSDDTSGEDEDEELDSELAEFVVRSDQPIEMASSSQRLPDDTQPPNDRGAAGNGTTGAAVRERATLNDDVEDSEGSDPGLAALAHGDDSGEESGVEEILAPAPLISKVRRRRVIGDSDSDE